MCSPSLFGYTRNLFETHWHDGPQSLDTQRTNDESYRSIEQLITKCQLTVPEEGFSGITWLELYALYTIRNKELNKSVTENTTSPEQIAERRNT